MESIGLLGLGYVGQYLTQSSTIAKILSRNSTWNGSSQCDLAIAQSTAIEAFLDGLDSVIVTIPAQHIHPSNWEALRLSGIPTVVCSTTSLYQRDGATICESSPLDTGHVRFPQEQSLANWARLVRLSGIYGPGRNPRDWLANGRVIPNPRQVNFIHIDDIKTILVAAATTPDWPATVNAADGQEHTWQQIADFLVANGLLSPQSSTSELNRQDVFIENNLLRQLLPQWQAIDFWQGLRQCCEMEHTP